MVAILIVIILYTEHYFVCCHYDQYYHRYKRWGRGIGNGNYRRVSLSYSFVVPLMNLVCNMIT